MGPNFSWQLILSEIVFLLFDRSAIAQTPITAMGCQQCLPLSVVQLKGKHCRKPHCRNGVVGIFGL